MHTLVQDEMPGCQNVKEMAGKGELGTLPVKRLHGGRVPIGPCPRLWAGEKKRARLLIEKNILLIISLSV